MTTVAARQIIAEVAARRGVDPRDILRACRKPKVFRARIEVAERLRARGYSSPQIGRCLNKDHTTVLYYLGLLSRKVSDEQKPRWRKPHIRHLARIKMLPPPQPEERQLYLLPYAGAYMKEYHWKERRP